MYAQCKLYRHLICLTNTRLHNAITKCKHCCLHKYKRTTGHVMSLLGIKNYFYMEMHVFMVVTNHKINIKLIIF